MPLTSGYKRMSDPEYLIANGFNDAIIGIGWRINLDDVVCYDYDKCVEILMKQENMEWEEAIEWMDYNVCGSWMGDKTPIFIRCDPTLDGTIKKEKCEN